MDNVNFHYLEDSIKISLLEASIGSEGSCVSVTSGLCGEIYVFDQGENTNPRYFCAKIPKRSEHASDSEIAQRFITELTKQLTFYNNMFVHWAFDFEEVLNVPIALFRYWGNDLEKVINNTTISTTKALTILIFACAGLKHCYKRGLKAHQDLKPANIFIRNIKNEFKNLPDLDIYDFPMIADFGLANCFEETGVYDGSRPYMAPEQWGKRKLSPKTDIFALGIILHETITNGYHPIGIKTSEYWPKPIEGNSNKYTRPVPWKKWISRGCTISDPNKIADMNILTLIEDMLSIDQSNRPTIDNVISRLMTVLEQHSKESHQQVNFLIHYFESKASMNSLEESWPYLDNKWKKFQLKFSGNS